MQKTVPVRRAPRKGADEPIPYVLAPVCQPIPYRVPWYVPFPEEQAQ